MDFYLALLLFIAGVFTVFAPCIFVLLPVVLGGGFASGSYRKGYIIVLSLFFSVFIFAVLFKGGLGILNIEREIFVYISGVVLTLFGYFMIFPKHWGKVISRLGYIPKLSKLKEGGSVKASIILGISLGPVFSSCSPTFALLLATILPLNFFDGTLGIAIYLMGLSVPLLLILFFGIRFVNRFKWLVDPESKFKKLLGVIFMIIGLMVITGIDKMVERTILENNLYLPSSVENKMLDRYLNR